MDFKAYQSQIRTLIPLRNKADFSTMLDKIFFGESTSDKFLIKMELSRLAKPCSRIIDLREKVTDYTQQFTHQDIMHYLTPSADKELTAAIKLYGDYTIGAYEQVLEHVQKVKQEKSTTPGAKTSAVADSNITENIQLDNHNKRFAARMFFVSKIMVTLEDGSEHQASTSNISISGLKVKLSEKSNYLDDQFIKVNFIALGNDYKDKAITGQKLTYRLVKQQQEKTGFYLYLNLEDDKPDFVNFIKLFIRNNQYKYKLDVHYHFRLAREKLIRTSTLMYLSSLPIYLNAAQNSPLIFSLRNLANGGILNDWHSNNTDQLSYLFSRKRLATMLSMAQPKLSTTVYCFTYISKGEEFFLSATEEELKNENLKHLFLEYGRTKSNWRCYHLTLQNYEYEAQKIHGLTDIKPSIFDDITHLATLTEIATNEIIEIDHRSDEKRDLNLLNIFVHREKQPGFVPVYDLFPDELRKEERYNFNSVIKLTAGKEICTGKIVDFSMSGLKIQLDAKESLARRSLIKIDFIELQKLSKQFILSNIEYRVIFSGPNNTFHLQVATRDSYLTMHQFFSILINNNPTHFQVIPLKANKQPVTSRLQEAAESALHPAFFYVSTQNLKAKIGLSSIADTSKALKQLFNINSEAIGNNNHLALSNKRLLERILHTPLRTVSTLENSLNFECTIYVQKILVANKNWEINSYLDEDFKSKEVKRKFILENKELKQLQILHYRLTSIKAPDLAVISSEINILSCYAKHLGQRIEEEILKINALIQVTDRTKQVLGD